MNNVDTAAQPQRPTDPSIAHATEVFGAAIKLLSIGISQLEALQASPSLVFITDKELAQRLGVSLTTVRNQCKGGRYEGAMSFGRAGWRIPESSVAAAFSRQARRASDETEFDINRIKSWRKAR